MIPIRLDIKNFMAYRDAPSVDFSGLHVVCLTGENGAGKSALLDAMTWALWGQARSKRDDELISQGETEMRVCLVFNEGGNTYQVVRTRKLGRATARNKAPVSSGTLDLLVEDKGSWRTLNESRQTETQGKIVDILNLSYDTFVNSAFLKQGRADEFTLKTPAERKALLAEILSLEAWLIYEEKVKAQQAELDRSQRLIEFELQQAEIEIGRLPVYIQELIAAQAAVTDASDVLQTAEKEMAEIEQQRERLKALRIQRTQAGERLKAIQIELIDVQKQHERHQSALNLYQAAIQQREDILQGYEAYQAAVRLNDEYNLKLASLVDLNIRKSAVEGAVADARRVLESERDAAQHRLSDLEKLADDRSIRDQLARVKEQGEQLNAQLLAHEDAAQKLSELRERQTELKTQNDELKRRMKELKPRIDALASVSAICPTCGRELDENDRQRIMAEWNDQGRQWGDTYRSGDEQLKSMAATRAAFETKMAELEKSLLRMPANQREAAALEERLTHASQAAEQLDGARALVDRLQAVLNEQDYAREKRSELASVIQDLVALGYDAAGHRQLRDMRLPELQGYVERKNRLDRSEIGIESESLALESLALRERSLMERQSREESLLAEVIHAITAAEAELQRAAQVEAILQRARLDYFSAQRKVGEANQRVQSCRALEGKRDRLHADLEILTRKQSSLGELRLAFSKNGVPAMIIEAILPELEDSANELLNRMTNGRMNVRFETQRQTQKGDVSETLELRISDELGERPYEMFSGGEAFRINFAIRVALSKLLANRAGARLQTLFTDEGFGTQDAQGRERLVEAITSIQDDFELIVVITHIEELKDAFSARIDITKALSGSIARVV